MCSSKDCLDAGHKLLGIKGLFHVIVCTKLETKNLVEHLTLCAEHDDGGLRFGADFAADLISVDSGKHQVQQNQVRGIGGEQLQSLFAVRGDLGIIALLIQVQTDELRNVRIIVHD